MSNKPESARGGRSASDDRWSSDPTARWLLTEGWSIASPVELVSKLARRLSDSAVPLLRLRIVIRTLHPLVFGRIYSWSRTSGLTEERCPPHDILETKAYRDSPIAAVLAGAGTVRRRLQAAEPQLDYPYLADLIAEGATDYVALPVIFSDGKINVLTLVTDYPGGFREADLNQMGSALPALARVLEMRTLRHLSETLMETYLGRFSGPRILDGLIKRGDGEKIHAVIWFADLRDSTAMAEAMPAEEFLALLDGFFDCMAGAVLYHGGEVLSYIGDAVLAIFPISCESEALKDTCKPQEDACREALVAARDARDRIRRLNNDRRKRREQALGFGLALHVGNLMYGNIGVPQRLQFTAIGAAVNEAARIQDLCKELGHQILASSTFAECFPAEWVFVGDHELRGVGSTRGVYMLADNQA